LNLDYCAAGHFKIGHVGINRRSCVTVFEIHTAAHTPIMAENVYLDQAPDMSLINDFYEKRTELYNETMIQLGMPYRFGHFWAGENVEEDIAEVMQSLAPPSSEWWAQNYVHIGATFPWCMAYTAADTRFQDNWTIVRRVYQTVSSYKFTQWPIAIECSNETQKMFDKLYMLFKSNVHISQDAGSSLHSSLESQIIAELESLDLFSPVASQHDYPMVIISGLKCFFGAVSELWRMQTSQRWKMREALVYRIGPIGAEGWYDYGHHDCWCYDPLRIKFRMFFSQLFWFDKHIT
jgi:hypothetical protein